MLQKQTHKVTLAGGTAPFTFNWYTDCTDGITFVGRTDLQTVEIQVDTEVVTDNGCTLYCEVVDGDGKKATFSKTIAYNQSIGLSGLAAQVSAKTSYIDFHMSEVLKEGLNVVDWTTLQVNVGASFMGTYQIYVLNGIIRYTPPETLPSTDFVDVMYVSVADTVGNRSNEVPVAVVLFPPAALPYGAEDAITTALNTPVTFSPVANDPADIRRIAVSVAPRGSIVVDGLNVTYTPPDGFEGDDWFYYVGYDANGNMTEETLVTVTVEGASGTAPTVSIISLSERGGAITLVANVTGVTSRYDINVVLNNILQDMTAFSYDAGTGTLSGNMPTASGSLQQVTVTASNDSGDAVANMSLSLTLNLPPVAGNDSFTGTFDTSTIHELLDNDSDPEGATLSITHLNGTAVGIGDSVALTNGSVMLFSATEIQFTPNTGWSGSQPFTYTIFDGALTDIGVVTMNVVNPCPGTLSLSYSVGTSDFTITSAIANISAPTYTWYMKVSGNWILVTGETTATLTRLHNEAGEYRLVVTENSCTYTAEITINI